MRYTPQSSNFDDISRLIWDHLKERDWLEADPRSLAISIVLEATELLEHYQWSSDAVGDKTALAEELADIFIYAFQFAQHHNIDIANAIRHKLDKAAKKYPAEQFKGKKGASRNEAWLNAKLDYQSKKQGL